MLVFVSIYQARLRHNIKTGHNIYYSNMHYMQSLIEASFKLSRCTRRCVQTVCSGGPGRTGTNREGIRVRRRQSPDVTTGSHGRRTAKLRCYTVAHEYQQISVELITDMSFAKYRTQFAYQGKIEQQLKWDRR